MLPFDTHNRTRFVFGKGTIGQLGELASSFQPSCVLVVTDSGLVDAGHFEAGVASLRESGLRVESFHDFGENPTSAMVDAGVRKAAEVKPDLLIGLGGGSSMDCCKGINFVYSLWWHHSRLSRGWKSDNGYAAHDRCSHNIGDWQRGSVVCTDK